MENEINKEVNTNIPSTKNPHQNLDPVIKEKMKKNLIYIGIFSIVMVFAGLTSGYIVSMGDSFWVKFNLPNAFYQSTAVIILSSIFIQISITAAKRDKLTLSKLFVVLTFVFGLMFVYFQFKGYGQLVENGSHLRGDIMVADGRYGSSGEEGKYYGYYEIKYNNKFIELDGNDYLIEGKIINVEQFAELKKFVAQFENYDSNNPLKTINLNNPFRLYYKQQEVSVIKGKLALPDSTELEFVDLNRLKSLAINIKAERGDFFLKGKIGKDFHVYFKGKELEYKDRLWQYKGKVLDDYLQTKPLESPDTASSYLWLITVLHLLHIIFTLFYMAKMVVFSVTNKFNSTNTLSLRLGAVFWHFLGILWIYLLLFLVYIH